MKIAIIGGKGRIGRVLAQIFSKGGHEIESLDREDSIDIETVSKSSDLVFLAVPISESLLYIEKGKDLPNLVEVSSVKAPFKKYAGSIMSIHPLFGPKSVNSCEPKQLLFIEDISRKGSKILIENLFSGFETISIAADDHDRAMSRLMVAPYLMAEFSKALLKSGLGFTTNSFRKASKFSTLTDDESSIAVSDTIMKNPYTRDMLTELSDLVHKFQEGIA